MCTCVYVFYFKIKRVFDNHKFAAADAISKSDYLSKASVGILVQFVVNFTSKGGSEGGDLHVFQLVFFFSDK